MRNAATGHNLAPIPYTREPITPLPEVVEDNSEEAWIQWDRLTAPKETT